MKSGFHQALIFLTKLAYKNRLTVPTLITVAFLAFNFRWEVEISIQTERIANLQENDESDETDVSFDSIGDEYEIDSSDDTDEDTDGIENSF